MLHENLPIPPASATRDAWTDKEIVCLTRMVYGEARNQRFPGQVAVAAVAVNRSLEVQWPKDVCEVVRQRNQFTGYWAVGARPKRLSAEAAIAWKRAELAALWATEGYTALPASYRAVRYFQSGKVAGFHLTLVAQGRIGAHTFYL